MPYIGKSPSAGVRQRYQYTATAGQTTFSGTDLGNLTLTYTDNNFVDVFQNGVLLKGGTTDYTATSGSSVVLTTGASVSDVIEIIVYDVFSVGNFYSRTDSDSRYVNVDGTTAVTITTADNSDNLTLTSTDADASAGPNLRFYRNSASPADNDLTGVISFDGRNDNSQDFTLGEIQAYMNDASDGTEDSSITYTVMSGGSAHNAMQFNPTETTFNESSVDRDFRVESNGNAYMIFVDGGNDTAYVGGSTDYNGTLNVAGDGVGVGNSDSSYRRMYWNTSNTDMRFWNGTNEAIINDSGAFVDASDEKLKKDIADITYGIDTVKALKPRKYKIKATNKEQVGFIAQEVESIVPEIVTVGTNPNGVEQKGLAYGQLTAVLAKAVQELSAKNDALEARIKKLEDG